MSNTTTPDPNCKHLDLTVQRNQGYRWVTCTDCLVDFFRLPVVDEAMIERGIEAIKGIPVMATRTAVEAVLRAALEVNR